MADNKTTYGIDFEVDGQPLLGAGSALQQIETNAEGAEAAMSAIGQAAGDAGSALQGALANGQIALDNADSRAKYFNASLRAIAQDSNSVGEAFAGTFSAVAKQGASLGSSIKAGIGGALEYTQKRANDFGNRFKQTATNVLNAVKRPTEFIRGKLTEAFSRASEGAGDMGEAGAAAGDQLQDAGDKGESAFDRLISKVKSFAIVAAGIKVIQEMGKKVVEFGKQAVAAFSEAQTAAKSLGRVFDDDTALTWFDDYAKAANRPQTDVRALAKESKAFFDDMGHAEATASDMSKTFVGLSYDLEAVTGVKAADNFAQLEAAMGGDSKAARQLGYDLSDTALNAQASADGFKKQFDKLKDSEKAQIRFNALLAQSNDVYGKAIDGQEGVANATESLNGIWQNFLTGAGEKLGPVLESAMGMLLELWPSIEPILMQLVEMLGSGIADALPPLMELAEGILPILADTILTVGEALAPLLPVFMQIVQTILPPILSVLGMVAETILPPIVDILTILLNTVVKPLMPLLEVVANAILPPIASLLEAISPILKAIAPVMEIIGGVIGIIAEGLGKIIGWLADGVGKVGDFFSGLFGGSKEAKKGTDDLSKSVNAIDTKTMYKDADQSLGAVGKSAQTNYAIAEKSAATSYGNMASKSAEVSGQQQNDLNTIEAVGSSAYNNLETEGVNAWSAMALASDLSTQKILSNIDEINNKGITTAGDSDITPHAKGTDYHPGGLALVGEKGPEIINLPRGSQVYTADETQEMLGSPSNDVTREGNIVDIRDYFEDKEESPQKSIKSGAPREVIVSIAIEKIEISGGDTDEVMDDFESKMKTIVQAAVEEALSERDEADYTARQIQW